MDHVQEDGRSDEDRIREKAYELWLGEGCPDGRAELHWLMAREIIAVEDSGGDALLPVEGSREASPTDEPVEPSSAVATQGDVPGLADQGEETPRFSPAPAARR